MRPKRVILVVDDNEAVLSVRRFLLETHGYRVLTADSGESALKAMKTLSPDKPGHLDLLMTSWMIPDMDGNELCRRAKQLHPSLKTMIVSGTVADPTQCVADGFALKGSSAESLLQRVRILVARKRGPKKAVVAACQ